jgi:WD repeat-containing protein 23
MDPYRKPRFQAAPGDNSVMQYRGHSVCRTLIRAHFAPENSTGHDYVYSGSADGRIHIWNLDGTIVQVLDRRLTAPLVDTEKEGVYNDPSGPETARERAGNAGRSAYCVRVRSTLLLKASTLMSQG